MAGITPEKIAFRADEQRAVHALFFQGWRRRVLRCFRDWREQGLRGGRGGHGDVQCLAPW